MILFVVRHGQTTANVDKIYSGHSDVPLTEEGRQQAAAIAPILENMTFDRVYSSDLSRAIDTQRLALPGVEGVRTPLLREIDVGRAAGYPWGQVPDAPADWNSKTEPDPFARVGGESYAQLDARVGSFLKMLETDPCDRAVAFVHNGVIGAVMRNILGPGIVKGALYSENCAIHAFSFEDGKWRLLAWNYGKVL